LPRSVLQLMSKIVFVTRVSFPFLIEYPIPFIKLEMFIVWVHCKIYLLKNVNIPLKITKKMLFTHVYMYDYIILVRICSSFH